MPTTATQLGGQVTLVAMPPSGEVFLARDSDGLLWLVSPPGAGGPERVDDDIVARAIADHGFERIDEQFAGWAELDVERQRRAGLGMPPIQIDVGRFDAEDVERVMRALQRYRLAGQVPRARRVAHRLLQAPVLQTERALYERVVAFLVKLDATPTVTPEAVVDEQRLAARQRVRLAS